MPFQTGGAAGGVTTLSDLQIDVDKDWKAHGIYNLGDLTPKVDGAYNLGGSDTKFDTVYAGLMSDSIYKRNLRTGVVDTSYLTDNAATAAKVDPSVDLEFVRSNDNTVAGSITPKVDGAYNLGSSANKFNTAYATSFPAPSTLIYKSKSGIADAIYNATTNEVPADFLDKVWSSGLATDIVYNENFNLPSAEARDKVAESTYGVAKDITGVKGFSYQLNEKRDFAFRTETPNHAYWHRMYNTPAAFETVYQGYTTSMQKKGTTPSKSAPDTADPNPQPGALWSVSALPGGTSWVTNWAAPAGGVPGTGDLTWDGTYLWHTNFARDYIYQLETDGTQVGGFASLGGNPRGISWDGAYLWVGSDSSDFVYHVKKDGTQVGGWANDIVAGTFGNIGAVAWDGTYLWRVNHYAAGYIYKHKGTDGTVVDSFPAPTGATGSSDRSQGLTWDGTYLWFGDQNSDTLYQLKTDGTQVSAQATFNNPRGLAWDGAYLWEAADGPDWIYQLGNAGNFDVNYRIFAK